MANLDYQIAKEYLNKLPKEQQTELINRTLGQEVKNLLFFTHFQQLNL